MNRFQKIGIAVFLAVITGSIWLITGERSLNIVNNGSTEKSQAGERVGRCKTPRRPVAVMLSSDKEARPLSGIADADFVFEMPVTNNGITRMMAVYECNQPKELGSIRSSRLDFIPIVKGLGAIYAHWGGEKQALQQLNAGVVNNIDGLKYEGSLYYRKDGKYGAPHNGFISFDAIEKGIKKLGYSEAPTAHSYDFSRNDKSQSDIQPPQFYKDSLRVDWKYDATQNAYTRSRGGNSEYDALAKRNVVAKNVIAMKAKWSEISKDYIRVYTVGSGPMKLYANGAVVSGTWKKETESSPLVFLDSENKQMSLVSGSTWVEILTDFTLNEAL